MEYSDSICSLLDSSNAYNISDVCYECATTPFLLSVDSPLPPTPLPSPHCAPVYVGHAIPPSENTLQHAPWLTPPGAVSVNSVDALMERTRTRTEVRSQSKGCHQVALYVICQHELICPRAFSGLKFRETDVLAMCVQIVRRLEGADYVTSRGDSGYLKAMGEIHENKLHPYADENVLWPADENGSSIISILLHDGANGYAMCMCMCCI